MNRFILIIATGLMTLALTSCGEQGGNKTPVGSQQTPTTTTEPTPNQPANGNQTPNP